MTIVIYADGGCAPNPGVGGYAFRVEHEDGSIAEGWGYARESTNNRMELTGAIQGLRRTPKGAKVELKLDSEYTLDCCRKWRKGWEQKGMMTAGGKPVANQEHVKLLWAEVDCRDVTYTHVPAHSGIPGNERVDSLVKHARNLKETKMPDEVFKADPSAPKTPAPAAAPVSAPVAAPAPQAKEPATAASVAQATSTPASSAASNTETLLMSLLSAKFGPQMRPDATVSYKDTAASIVNLLNRLGWQAPA